MGQLFDLQGKVAVVTGASRGIGRAIALRLAEHGAAVVVSSRKIEACEPVVREIQAAGGKALALACHIAFKDQLKRLIDTAAEQFGGLDIVVGNAAVNPYFGSSLDMPDEAFDKVMASNIKSNVWLANLAIPQLRQRGGGSIIIVSSIGGFLGSDVIGAYTISKAADLQIARNLAVEFGHENIRTNCIAPGLIRTDFAKALWENEEIAKQRMRTTPMRRIGEPDEIAGAAVFLASAAGQYMNGQSIIIDGGRVAGSPSEFS
jgi:NAD(P)-dependent dehydrogenase (short-subunit alcohol dehydrogenase family)